MDNNIIPNKFIYHKSNPFYRDSINQQGLVCKPKSETWLTDTDIYGRVIFLTNSNKVEDWFDSTYDDDIYEINTTKLKNKFLIDPNFVWQDNPKHIITYENIPLDSIRLIYKGSGEDLLF